MKVIETKLPTIAAGLEQRYPGVECRVTRTEVAPDDTSPGHALWTISFLAGDRKTLIGYGLATAEQFHVKETLTVAGAMSHRCMRDGLGGHITVVEWPTCVEARLLVMDYCNEAEKLTKKLQVEVDRMLRPFVRGTWTPPAVAS